jgi:ankyrin repeat protein
MLVHFHFQHQLYDIHSLQVGCTPLHRAASTGNSEMCELLIEEGAEVDAVDKGGQTPLMNAVVCHYKEVSLVGVAREDMFVIFT